MQATPETLRSAGDGATGADGDAAPKDTDVELAQIGAASDRRIADADEVIVRCFPHDLVGRTGEVVRADEREAAGLAGEAAGAAVHARRPDARRIDHVEAHVGQRPRLRRRDPFPPAIPPPPPRRNRRVEEPPRPPPPDGLPLGTPFPPPPRD